MSIDVTPAAVEAIRVQLKKRGAAGSLGALRVGLRGGGCSGLTYVLQFEDGPPGARDTVLRWDAADEPTVRVYVDPKSNAMLDGATLDYEKTLMRSGFKFINPAERSRCGCGESFST
jgi:iron-sulfur cluster assembly protein